MRNVLTTLSTALLLLSPLVAVATDQPMAPAHATAADSQDVVITLQRSACYGSCPAYEVTIHGDGHVQFTTGTPPVDEVDALHRQFARTTGVLMPGTHDDRVDPATVQALLAQFERAGFWRLKDEYRASVTDNPTKVVTLQIGERKKTVIDYVGLQAGMPKAVDDLETAIDRVAGTDRWTTGNPALISWLEHNGFDFHSNQAAAMAVDGESANLDEATVIAFIDRGAPLDQSVLPPGTFPGKTEVAGIDLIRSSITRGHAAVFQRLVKDGWLDRLGKAQAADLFAEDAAGCSPALVDAAADAGVNIDLARVHNTQLDDDDPQGVTALAALGSAYGCPDDNTSRALTASRLLARGANPNHRDSKGRTPLYGVEDMGLLKTLLAHGADATIKSNDGQSMLFGSWTDAIVLQLLKAGASPRGHYDDGKTLAEQAQTRDMPQVAQWLKAHPEAMH